MANTPAGADAETLGAAETGDWPDGRGAKVIGAAQRNHDLPGQKAGDRSQNLDLKGHSAPERRAVGSAA